MVKRVKWNIHVEPEVVFLRLSLLWGFSEDVLYLDNYTMLFCYFEYWCICVLHSIFFKIFVLHISSIKLLWYKVYGIRFRSEIICSSYRITAIVLWAKPFGCEKLNKRAFKLLSRCFFHLTLYFALLAKLKIRQTTETRLSQTPFLSARTKRRLVGKSTPRRTLPKPFQSRQP